MRLWTGGYTADGGGVATGVGVLLAGASDTESAGGQLAFAADAVTTSGSPSWLTAHPTHDVIYAALETEGAVQAFRRTGEASFVPLGRPVAAGAATCHVAVAPDGGSLLASCWGDGRIVRMDLDAEGRPSAPTIAVAAEDPYAAGSTDSAAAAVSFSGGDEIDLAAAARALREAAGDEYAHLVPDYDRDDPAQAAPGAAAAAPENEASDARVSRAHQCVFLPGGLIVSTDMGLDLVRFWRVGVQGLRAVGHVVLPLGSGPRHMSWHPSGHLYVLCELSREVFVLAPDASGAWRLISGVPLIGSLDGDTAAELYPSRDRQFLYAGIRGTNTIATVAVRGAGESLGMVALVESGVDWPRNHVVIRDTLLVAGQLSDEVAALTLDLRTGVPERARRRVTVPSPTCLLPVA